MAALLLDTPSTPSQNCGDGEEEDEEEEDAEAEEEDYEEERKEDEDEDEDEVGEDDDDDNDNNNDNDDDDEEEEEEEDDDDDNEDADADDDEDERIEEEIDAGRKESRNEQGNRAPKEARSDIGRDLGEEERVNREGKEEEEREKEKEEEERGKGKTEEEKGKDEEESPLEGAKMEIRRQVEEMNTRIEEIELQVHEAIQLRNSLSKGKVPLGRTSVNPKDRDKDKSSINSKKQQQTDTARREAATIKRMVELMRQFGTILRQITSHKWAWPFMKPVDVEGLQLHDYHEVIEKPMDLGTIRNKMEAKDGSGYKHVQEICDDVRLVFSNAMTYNQEGTDVHVMAKTLSEKFEDKWKTALEPKVIEEESKRRQEEKEAQVRDLETLRIAEEAALEKHATDLSNQMDELHAHLEVLRQEVASHCRMMTTEEKRQLGQSLSQLSPEDLSKAIQIIAQKNPDFKTTEQEVEVDIDAQDAATLWRIQHFVRAVVISQNKNVAPRSQQQERVRKSESYELPIGKAKKRPRKVSP